MADYGETISREKDCHQHRTQRVMNIFSAIFTFIPIIDQLIKMSTKGKKMLVRMRVIHVASVRHLIFTNMLLLLIYRDLFQDDKDLCRVLAALQLGSHVTSVTIPQATACDLRTVVGRTAGSTSYATPASGPSSALHDQPPASIASPPGKYPYLSSKTGVTNVHCCAVHIRQDPIPNSVYRESLGKRTGIMDTWYVLQALMSTLLNELL
jgi:hypothetical protein